ncbi:hypothetical protein Slin14017_G130680 [Septoria linicola]|nr:hypothetical protein Slin14017_G130680 [Septoria linicola]
MSAITYANSLSAQDQRRKASKVSLSAGLHKMIQKAKNVDMAFGTTLERVLKRFSPPRPVSPQPQEDNAEPDRTHSARPLAELQNLSGEVQDKDQNPFAAAFGPAVQSAGSSKPSKGKARATNQDFEDFRPVPRPAPPELYGRSVSVVDTSACVDPIGQDPQNLQGCLRRSNAIRRTEAPEWLRNGKPRPQRERVPMFHWIRDVIEKRSGPVGVELLPPHPDNLALLLRTPKEQSAEPTEYHDMLPPMELYALGVLGGDERSACRAMPTMDENTVPWTTGSHNADSTPRSARSDDDNVPLLLLRPMPRDRRNSPHHLDQNAPPVLSYDSIGRRLVDGPSHLVQIHRSGSIHSQVAVICDGDDLAD